MTRSIRAEMKAGFERVDEKFERVDEKFERLYRLIFTACAGVIGTLIAASAGLIATQI